MSGVLEASNEIQNMSEWKIRYIDSLGLFGCVGWDGVGCIEISTF